MTVELAQLRQLGAIGPLDLAFAAAMGRIAGEADPRALVAAALASRATSAGHSCVDLGRLAGRPVDIDEVTLHIELRWPDRDGWLAAVSASPLVSDGSRLAPLVLDPGGRLYLARYWRYQSLLAAALRERAVPAGDLDGDLLEEGLTRLFPPADPDLAADQRRAARVALERRLAVISGGPGTGKTTTAARILALLVEQSLATEGGAPPRIVLTAPTGKAAARLAGAIGEAKRATGERAMRCSAEVLEAIPEVASTLHRALGARRDRPTRFRHDASRPLAAEVVVVDEASMVDLALMAKLVDAVRPDARLLLLGDRDQLSAVEAGAVLGDICATNRRPVLAPSVVQLEHSFRFGAAGGIGRLARAINSGDGDGALAVLADPGVPEVQQAHAADTDALDALLQGEAVQHYAGYLGAADPGEALDRLGSFRVLAAHRQGPWGVTALNPAVEQALALAGLLTPDREWYGGRPVLVTANDYRLGLFNGDVGLVRPDPESGEQRAHFEGNGGTLRALAPSRLPRVETVFATTVHKSQGSEFRRVVVVLPDHRSPVLTRELLYTAVTRASGSVLIVGSDEVIREAVSTPVERVSGLADMLR